MNTALIVVAVALLVWFAQRFRQGMRVKPYIIRSLRLGILNLKGASISEMVEDDNAAISGLFSSTVESTNTPPKCDVLFVYCELANEGQVVGSASGLREIIRDSGAYVVIVASENSSAAYTAAGKPAGYGQANLVLTLERRGSAFKSFYRQLFGEMAKGVSMPVAWVKLAPQISGHDHSNCPVAIFACEVGQIAFGHTLGYDA